MSEQSQEHVKVRQCDQVLEVSIFRPDKKNALNLAMYQAMKDAIDLAEASTDVRVVVITGSRGCFTSGNDLAVFAEPTALTSYDNPIYGFMKALSLCKKPVVAAVDGVAIGIGTTLLLHCDMVIASPSAEFKLPFASLGLVPEYASSLLLPRLVGHAKASEWLMLGCSISAEEGLEAGFINHIDDMPLERAHVLAQALAKMPPQALRQTKALLREPVQAAVEQTIENEVLVFSEALKGAEFAEAATAFFEKRKPDFSKFS